jgi:hypothetical protein
VAPRQLTSNSVVCAKGLYNVEARPTCAPPAVVDLPVRIQILDGNRNVVRSRADSAAPYLLWGSKDPALSRRLPNGKYHLASSISGGDVITIWQACSRRRSQCPPTRKGGMGMMAMRCPSGGMT